MKTVDVLKSGSLNSPIGPTGTLRRLLQNKEYLLNRGYDLNIFTHDSLSKNNKLDIINSSQVRSEKKNKIYSILKKHRILSFLYMIWLMLLARKLVMFYKKLNRMPDVVVFHDFFVYDQFVRVMKKQFKLVHFFHSNGLKFEMLYENFPKLRRSLYARYIEKRFDSTIELLDKAVFIAKIGQINFLKTNPQFDKLKTTYFHNGIDDISTDKKIEISELPGKKNYKYRLCCTGTISERKGQYLILNALSKLDKEILKDIHVTLIGTGSQISFLKEFVLEHDIDKHVSFEGRVDNDKIYKYLAQANIYILMSNNEGLPISIIEAMRSGLPIISAKVAGIPELVKEHYNGMLIEPNEFELLKILNNISEYDWKQMGVNSRKRFENEFTFDLMRNAYCNMLDSLFIISK